MDIYRMQMKYSNEDGGENIVDKALKQNKITSNEKYAKKDFQNLTSGTVVFIHAGQTPKALIKVLHKIPDNETQEPSFGIDYKVEILSYYEDAIKEFPQIGFRPTHNGTFVLMDKNESSYQHVFKWYSLITKKHQQKQQMQHYINLLKQKHQIIFTGAPGTGKTFLARKITEKMVENKGIQINFVQFHPSYDYADFMEGLRPIMKGDNQLGFELKNGTFKEFCRKAGVIERLVFAKKQPTDKNLKEFLNVDENHKLFTFWQQYKDTEIKDLPKFVFLIDEINRAEISKVFGELFFSIDVGYRGEKGTIKTQYANMQNEKTFFVNKEDDYFFVPSNVYIIGTMNDIDRSVEMFDFAMRRRFAWEEIKVETTLNSILSELKDEKLQEQAKAKINALNNAISGIEGLNSSYHVGGAYFLKLKEDNSFENLWKYHLETLLKEYLRGLPDAEQKLIDLKQVYDKAN